MLTAIEGFSGVGGFAVGGRKAGVRVVWAGNHWRAAVDCYEANHGLKAACKDMHRVIWRDVPRFRVGFFSPACQGHCDARAVELPHHDDCRDTMWAVLDCAEIHRKADYIIENVPEVQRWDCWPAWKLAWECLGFSVSLHIVDAADHGVPQNRERALVLCTRSRSPLVLDLPKRAPVAASTVIDWTAPGWTPVRDKCLATRQRVAAGRREHGDTFVCPYYGSGSGLTGRSLDRPIGTITTRDRWLLVDGKHSRFLNVAECRAFMGFPPGFKLPANKKLAKHLLGNAVCPPVITDFLNAYKKAA